MTRRVRKLAPPAPAALSVPGIRVVVAEPDCAPAAAPPPRAAAKSPAKGETSQHRKRRVKFVF